MPEMTLKNGEAYIHYQFNSARGTNTALIYQPTKDFLMRGRLFTYVITVADEATYNWVNARASAIHESLLAQEPVLKANMDQMVVGFVAEHQGICQAAGCDLLSYELEARALHTKPFPKESLLSPLLMCSPITIYRRDIEETTLHKDRAPTTRNYRMEDPNF